MTRASILSGMQQRQLTSGLIATAIIVILTLNLFPFHYHGEPVAQKVTKLTPPSEAKADPLRKLPPAERDLFKKVLKTKYPSIWMAPPEVNLVLRYIHGKQNYLEWGSGGSTINFPRWVENAVSIEHDQVWCYHMQEKLARIEKLTHIDYHCVPVKRGTAGWGLVSPFEEGSYEAFRPYVDEIGNTGIELFNFVLIDGRARVDCAIKALSYIKEDSVVVLHDSSRVWGQGAYRDVLQYYDFLNFIDGFGRQGVAVMKRKKEFQRLQGDHQSVQQILDQKYVTASQGIPIHIETKEAR